MKQKLLFGTLLSGAMMATVSVPSYAQSSSSSADDEIIVTGSRIKRKDLESVSPLNVTASEEIEFSGYTRIEDMMNSLPQIEAAQNGYISNGASGTASLDLRGLGANRTLVLINGRRMAPGGIYSQAPDVNQIPGALVERAETITGGASSTYGADAVAGVVNYIMKTDFDGVEASFRASAFQHNNDNEYIQELMDRRGFDYPTGSTVDGLAYNADFVMGSDFADEKGHAVGYVTYRKQEELRQGARDYSSCALNAAGTSCGGSFNAVIPNFDQYGVPSTDLYLPSTDENGVLDGGTPSLAVEAGDVDYNQNLFYTLDPNGGFRSASGNLYNYAPINHFLRPDERYAAGMFANYEVNNYFNPYLEVNFMLDKTKAQIAESGTFFAEEYALNVNGPQFNATQVAELNAGFSELPTFEDSAGTEYSYVDAAGNPLTVYPFSGDFASYVGKRNVEGGPRRDNLEHNSFRFVLGTNGDVTNDGRFTYDASFQYGTTTSSSFYENDFVRSKLRPAIADNSYPVYTYQGVSPEAAAVLTGNAGIRGETTELVANAYISGNFDNFFKASNDIQTIVGVEYREEGWDRTSDLLFEEGGLLGQGGTTKSFGGKYRVNELFGELLLPVFDGGSLGDLELELGGRYSNYSTAGGTGTYKIGGRWQFIDMFQLRGSYNRAVRAPNVGELFSAESSGLWGGTDPCTGSTPEFTLEQCMRTGVTATQYGSLSASPASQYNGLYSGNLDLDVEKADTISVGTVIRPIQSMNITVDYWDINIKDVIATKSAKSTLDECGLENDTYACSLIHRSPAGSLWIGSAGVGNSGYVDLPSFNFAKLHYTGIDGTFDWGWDALNGRFVLDGVGTYLLKKFNSINDIDCAGIISADCFASPSWRHKATFSYAPDSSKWTWQGIWRYYGQVDYEGTRDQLLVDNGGIDAQNYLDTTFAYSFNDTVGVVFGVNNILDKEPPLVGGTLSTNANSIAGFYDTLGRYFHGTVKFKL